MVFSSFAFLFLFLPVFFAGYFGVGRGQRNLWLLVSSLVFYGWERPYWVLIMLASTLFDYTIARVMGALDEGRAHRRALLVMSIVVNLGLLCWFKYANFFVHTVEHVTGAVFGWQDVVLPVGISFYTFQSMSYTIDVYRGDVRPTRSLVDFACYVTMFPQLVAGPIVRYSDVHAQIVAREHSTTMFGAGALSFCAGFAKKVLIADTMAPIVAAGLALPAPGLVESWTSLVAYSAQIYFDFSGYSDMAIGLGLMLGFRFTKNFDSPYLSQSITESWRRWHISLSTWLRDYLYIPLGGNRLGKGRTYVNLLTTMALGGLWHGANWPFVLWGVYHGLLLCIERFAGRPFWSGWPRPLRILTTWLLFTFGWSMFIARDAAHLWAYWRGLFGFGGAGEALVVHTSGAVTLGSIGVVYAIVWLAPNTHALLRRIHPLFLALVAVGFAAALAHSMAVSHLPFLYFRF